MASHFDLTTLDSLFFPSFTTCIYLTRPKCDQTHQTHSSCHCCYCNTKPKYNYKNLTLFLVENSDSWPQNFTYTFLHSPPVIATRDPRINRKVSHYFYLNAVDNEYGINTSHSLSFSHQSYTLYTRPKYYVLIASHQTHTTQRPQNTFAAVGTEAAAIKLRVGAPIDTADDVVFFSELLPAIDTFVKILLN